MSRLRRLTIAALVVTLVQVGWGALTRGSGSGYGCSDRWPLCENGLIPIGDIGGLLPRWEFEMVVEWTHRLIALLVGVAVVWLALHIRKAYRGRKDLIVPAFAAIGVVIVQSLLGAAVVISDLNRDLVTVHLVGAMTLLALLSYLTVTAYADAVDLPEKANDAGWTRLLLIGAALVITTLVLGSSVHDFHAFDGWPLPGGELVPEFGTQKQALHYSHRIAAAVAWAYLVYLQITAKRQARPDSEYRLMHVAGGLFTLNVGLGAVHVFTEVSSTVTIVAHLVLAATVWATLVAIITLAYQHAGGLSGGSVPAQNALDEVDA